MATKVYCVIGRDDTNDDIYCAGIFSNREDAVWKVLSCVNDIANSGVRIDSINRTGDSEVMINYDGCCVDILKVVEEEIK